MCDYLRGTWITGFRKSCGGTLLAISCCVALLLVTTRGYASERVATELSSLSGEARLDVLRAILKNREFQLRNIDYTLHISTANHSSDGHIQPFKENVSMRFQRLDDQYLITRSRGSNLEDPFRTTRILWNGREQRYLTTGQDINEPHGGMREDEPMMLWETRFNIALGLNIPEGRIVGGVHRSTHPPLSQYLSDAVEAGQRVHVDVANEAGREHVVVSVNDVLPPEMTDQVSYRQFTLDPDRGFLCTRWEVFITSKTHSTLEVTEALNIDGIWVPAKVITTARMEGIDVTTVVSYEATDISRNTVTADDLEIPFPPGTGVVDRIRKVAYRVSESGSPILRPLYDHESGEIIDPRPRPIEEILEDATVTGSPVQPLASEAIQTPSNAEAQASGSSKQWLIALFVVLGLILCWRVIRVVQASDAAKSST